MWSVNHSRLLVAILTGAGIGIFLVTFLTTTPKPYCPGAPSITINGVQLRAAYACTKEEQAQGLSDISEEDWLKRADAMVFHFEDSAVRHFWMKGMQFPLDVLWVQNGQIVKMEGDIQPPAPGTEPIRMNSAPHLVETVIELPAGSIDRYGLTEGDHFVNLRP